MTRRTNATCWEAFLESLGYHVREASSAEEAIDMIRGHVPDMVLLDVRLPGMSGIEALAEVRKISERLPVLLITAYADLRQSVTAMKSGADDYLAKTRGPGRIGGGPSPMRLARPRRQLVMIACRSCPPGSSARARPCDAWSRRPRSSPRRTRRY